MRGEIKKPVTEQDIREWEKGWAEMMITIWRENILRLRIYDTGRLHDSLTHQMTDMNGQITIAHEFMLYGIFVARGVGKGYQRGNGGSLEFLEGWKDDWKKGRKHRLKRDWFANKYLRSIYVLSRVERDLYGNAYLGTASNVIAAMFGGEKVTGSNGTDVANSIARF